MTQTTTPEQQETPEQKAPDVLEYETAEGTRQVGERRGLADWFDLDQITRGITYRLASARHDKEQRAEQTRERRRKKRSGADKGAAQKSSLALRATVGNVTLTDSTVIAWYTLETRATAFRPIKARERDIQADALAFSRLVGRRCYLRITPRPHSVGDWGKSTYYDAMRNARPLAGFADTYTPDGQPDHYLDREQAHMNAAGFSEKWVYMGVRVSSFRKYPDDAHREVLELRHVIEALDHTVIGSSLDARRATAYDMEWLLRSSVGLGLPTPSVGVVADYTPETTESLEQHARWSGEPLSGYITVRGEVRGNPEPFERKVAVLTLGRLGDQRIPDGQETGWMQRTDRLPFSVQWSAVLDVESEEKTRNRIRGGLDLIADQMDHYIKDHGMEPPRQLARQDQLGKTIMGELDSDHAGMELRTSGWYRVAVSGRDTKELNERVEVLRKLYNESAEFVRSPNQYAVAREFIPGEPLSTTAFTRRMSVRSLAAAIPQGTAEVGDRTGITLGYTAGSSLRSVAWAPHRDMEERDRSGLLVVGGGLGSGKSFAFGSIFYEMAVSGVTCHVLDPSDRLGRLCELPELKEHSRYVNLMRGRSGELGPYRVVADPKREHYASETEWKREMSDAEGTRTSLMSDILYDFLPESMKRSELTASIIGRALSDVPPVQTSTATDVLRQMERIANEDSHPDLTPEHRIRARDLLVTYQRIATTPTGKLIFPPADEPAPTYEELASEEDVRLTVYTLNGLAIPDEKSYAAGDAKENERLSMAVLQLAAWLVQSKIYETDRKVRKAFGVDEGKLLSMTSSGKTLIAKSATDSRKFNIRVVLCSQNVTHFNFSDSEDSLGNLVGAVLIGHTEDEAAIRAALRIMNVPLGQGYESILANLRSHDRRAEKHGDEQQTDEEKAIAAAAQKRHFIFYDGSGSERIVIDTDAHPHVVAALNSRPRADEEEALAPETNETTESH